MLSQVGQTAKALLRSGAAPHLPRVIRILIDLVVGPGLRVLKRRGPGAPGGGFALLLASDAAWRRRVRLQAPERNRLAALDAIAVDPSARRRSAASTSCSSRASRAISAISSAVSRSATAQSSTSSILLRNPMSAGLSCALSRARTSSRSWRRRAFRALARLSRWGFVMDSLMGNSSWFRCRGGLILVR